MSPRTYTFTASWQIQVLYQAQLLTSALLASDWLLGGCPQPTVRLSLCYQADISQSPAECYQSSVGNGQPFISPLPPPHTVINVHTFRVQSLLNLAFVYLLKPP